jgi:hypothetical protein
MPSRLGELSRVPAESFVADQEVDPLGEARWPAQAISRANP